MNMKESATMSETPVRKSSQVSTTVDADYFDALEDHRWTVRKKMTEIVKEALDDYTAKHKIQVKPAAPAETPAEAAPKKA